MMRFLTLLLAARAFAAGDAQVNVAIDAEVTAPGRIRGVMQVRCASEGTPADCADLTWTDPLAALPDPPDDAAARRTWTGKPEQGAVRWTATADGATFETELPGRYGDVGTSAGATFGNAGWYPQLLRAGRVVEADWTVTVRGPGQVLINGAGGPGLAHWEGHADRAALAVLPRGRARTLADGVRLVTSPGWTPTSGPAGERLLARVVAGLADRDLAPVTFVQVQDLRHLVRAAPGMVYVSDRTFRLLALLRPYHARAVRQAVIEATTPLPDGWDRAFVADAVSRSLPQPDLRRSLGWLTWNPVVDALLNDGTLPYYSDVFPEAFPDDPPLLERIGQRIPPGAASRQLDDLAGPGSALAEARRMLAGQREAAALEPLYAAWRAPYRAEQDYAVQTQRARPTALVREAPPDAPAEVVTATVDGQPRAFLVPGGPSTTALPDDAHTVQIDPDHHVADTGRANNRWPARWDVILSGGAGGISPTQRSVEVWGDLLLRPRGDTHNRALGILSHTKQDIVGVSAGYLRAFGPLRNRQLRQQRALFMLTGSYLDAAFRPTTAGAVALGAYAGWSLDTRAGDDAMRGHALGAHASGGFVPGSDERWAEAGGTATQLVPLHPRHVLAVRARAGWASGAVQHRLLTLGGVDDLRAVSSTLYVANEKALANLEYRATLFRNAQIPLPLLWWTELQIVPGAEYGVAYRNDGTRAQALGGTLGIHTVSDQLGIRGVFAGVTLAAPLWSEGLGTLDPLNDLQLYLDFAQAF